MALTLVTSDLIHGLDYSKLTGTITTWNQNTTGNAATATLAAGATILATARNIGGVSFNGSAAIDLPGVNAAGNQPTSGNAGSVTNGVYTVGDQTIAGVKTFSSGITQSSGTLQIKNASGDGSGLKLYQAGSDVSTISNNYAGDIAFNTANTSQKMIIKNSGNVGIGTSDPSSLLSLGNAIDAQKLLLYDDSNFYKYGFGIQSAELRQFFPNSATAKMTFGTISDSDGTTYSPKLTISSGGDATFSSIVTSSGLTVNTGNGAGKKIYLNGNTSRRNWMIAAQQNVDDAFEITRSTANGGSTYNSPSFLIQGSTGNVGIGTTSPVKTLDVQGQLAISNSASSYWYLDRNDSSGNFDIINDSNQVKLSISSGGTVSVSNPSSSTGSAAAGRLADSSVHLVDTTHVGRYSQITFGYPTSNTHASAYVGYVSTSSSASGKGDLVFGTKDNTAYNTQPSERLRISSGGNVGIGTPSPSAKLHVYNSGGGNATNKATMLSESVMKLQPHATNSTNLLVAQVDGGYGVGLQVTNGSATANWNLALSPFGGKVGIGIASPSAKLDVQGTTGTRNLNTTSGQASSIYETSTYYTAGGSTTTNVAIVTTTAFPSMGAAGYIMVEVSASGYGGSGSNGLVFSWIGGGYGGHHHIPASYHPVEIIADTHHSSCNVSIYYPNYNNVGITIVNSSGTSISGVMRVKVTTTY